MSKYICVARKDLPRCPLHGAELQLRTSRYGEFYGCPVYPHCSVIATWSKFDDHFYISDCYLRSARSLTHEVFDRLWLEGYASRGAAYRWLAEKLGMHSHKVCHIQHFNIDQCRKSIQVCIDMLLKCRYRKSDFKPSLNEALFVNVCRNLIRRRILRLAGHLVTSNFESIDILNRRAYALSLEISSRKAVRHKVYSFCADCVDVVSRLSALDKESERVREEKVLAS
jgi:ssDNA-binding Zn-finger/Zn-ribbon topoisomerase 1